MALVRGAVQTLSGSSVKSASGSVAFNLGSTVGGAEAAIFLLNVSASNTPTTLDVYLQTSPDGGTTWYDFAHFTQVGAVSTSIQSMSWTRRAGEGTESTSVIVTGDAALAAAKVINGPIVDAQCRAKWVIVGTSYTFALLAILDRD
jgi:predicted solute-binding protein